MVLFTAENMKDRNAASDMKGAVVTNVWSFSELHAVNFLPLDTDHLKRQVPRSRAALAFNRWRRSMREHEVVRLYALWDNGKDAESMPRLSRLLQKPEVWELLHYNLVRNLELTSDADDAPSLSSARIAQAKSAVEDIDKLSDSSQMKMLKNYRTENLAHNLDAAKRASARENGVPQPIIDEAMVDELFRKALELLGHVELAFTDTPTDWKKVHDHHRDCADALWSGCTLGIVR
jgi:hypothetical protein